MQKQYQLVYISEKMSSYVVLLLFFCFHILMRFASRELQLRFTRQQLNIFIKEKLKYTDIQG